MAHLTTNSPPTVLQIEAMESIKSSVEAAWRTDEIRRQKPTPQVCMYNCLYGVVIGSMIVLKVEGAVLLS
jgi:phosphoenolpyruvate carboxylase